MHPKVEELLSKRHPQKLKKAALELSERYRFGNFHLTEEEHRYAYLLTRLPATFAAISKVLEEIRGYKISSMLDCGAGPGTGWLAAKQFFSLEKGTFLERDSVFLEIGPQLAPGVWQKTDLQSCVKFESHDLILFSYSLGEMVDERAVYLAWEAAQKAVVVIEPGTPKGFATIRRVRSRLIELGAKIAAPCPHTVACPMATNDWCHFSVRLDRSSAHREAKGGVLGYEDEKFSYIIAVKHLDTPKNYHQRILRHPLQREGHRVFTVCSEIGIRNVTVSKKEKEYYKKCKKLEWGDML